MANNTPFIDFSAQTRWSAKEEFIYKRIFDRDQLNGVITPQQSAAILRASGMPKENLARIWVTVCNNCSSVDFFRFKMMCKYVALWDYHANYQPQHFSMEIEPLQFNQDPYKSTYQQAISEFAKTQVPVQQYAPQPQLVNYGMPVAPSGGYSGNSGASTPGGRPSVASGITQTVTSADFYTSATSWEHFTSEDFAKFKSVIGRLNSSVPGMYSNTDLADVIRSFQLPDKKDLTLIWKMTDVFGTKSLNLEGMLWS